MTFVPDRQTAPICYIQIIFIMIRPWQQPRQGSGLHAEPSRPILLSQTFYDICHIIRVRKTTLIDGVAIKLDGIGSPDGVRYRSPYSADNNWHLLAPWKQLTRTRPPPCNASLIQAPLVGKCSLIPTKARSLTGRVSSLIPLLSRSSWSGFTQSGSVWRPAVFRRWVTPWNEKMLPASMWRVSQFLALTHHAFFGHIFRCRFTEFNYKMQFDLILVHPHLD